MDKLERKNKECKTVKFQCFIELNLINQIIQT